MNVAIWQWGLIILSSLILFFLSPLARNTSIATFGMIPVFLNADILSTTTISGTMVIGLTPIFLLWKIKAPKISLYLSVFCGLGFGFLLLLHFFPANLIFTEGKYANSFGLIFGAYYLVISYI